MAALVGLTMMLHVASAGPVDDDAPLPPPLVDTQAPEPAPTVWDRLAACESNGRWHVNTGNGFYGGIQFDYGTWLRHGGSAFAPRADLASREQQILIGQRTQAAQGWIAWPYCSRRLGLR